MIESLYQETYLSWRCKDHTEAEQREINQVAIDILQNPNLQRTLDTISKRSSEIFADPNNSITTVRPNRVILAITEALREFRSTRTVTTIPGRLKRIQRLWKRFWYTRPVEERPPCYGGTTGVPRHVPNHPTYQRLTEETNRLCSQFNPQNVNFSARIRDHHRRLRTEATTGCPADFTNLGIWSDDYSDADERGASGFTPSDLTRRPLASQLMGTADYDYDHDDCDFDELDICNKVGCRLCADAQLLDDKIYLVGFEITPESVISINFSMPPLCLKSNLPCSRRNYMDFYPFVTLPAICWYPSPEPSYSDTALVTCDVIQQYTSYVDADRAFSTFIAALPPSCAPPPQSHEVIESFRVFSDLLLFYEHFNKTYFINWPQPEEIEFLRTRDYYGDITSLLEDYEAAKCSNEVLDADATVASGGGLVVPRFDLPVESMVFPDGSCRTKTQSGTSSRGRGGGKGKKKGGKKNGW